MPRIAAMPADNFVFVRAAFVPAHDPRASIPDDSIRPMAANDDSVRILPGFQGHASVPDDSIRPVAGHDGPLHGHAGVPDDSIRPFQPYDDFLF